MTSQSVTSSGTRGTPKEVVRIKHWGRWVSGIILVGLLAALIYAFAVGKIDWSYVGQYLTAPAVLSGLWATVYISVLSMLIGIVLGIFFAILRLSPSPVSQFFAWLYIWFFRGTPVYLQLLLWFNLALVFPTIGFFGIFEARTVDVMTPFLAALLGLGVNQGSYLTELIRGGILSVDHGQTQAAQALGMGRIKILRRIVLPQAMRVIVPPLGNEFIGLLKTSSLASAIAFQEVLFRSQQIYFVNTMVMELLLVAAFWYLIVVSIFSIGQYYVERYFARGQAVQQKKGLIEHVTTSLVTLPRSFKGQRKVERKVAKK
ncbi:amino acid ABC transporter permease [Gulosibacter sp. ACHW.36C]|uniref:Amino acid ABC transporter permease n=1 Tax=Gulosibacter sediminis TaxID=1729695 RepID=A0ABY4N092_9MICO|nr:amino acid ABC transporter permease [Gulosibacter sediminis]UQN14653.1 amino acid ABC transporter permease [Gulosibacter sediminis]